MWIDSHCHVSADEFEADRAAVLARALGRRRRRAGRDRRGLRRRRERGGRGAGGRGPARLRQRRRPSPRRAAPRRRGAPRSCAPGCAAPRVVAVGECGLDYWYEHSPREVQRAVFAEHVALARELGLPVSIHVRDRGADAYEELLEIWQREGGGSLEGRAPLLHRTTSPFARRALDAGLVVSFSGILTFKSAEALREVAAALPLDRLLVETDAPLLAPQGHRGRAQRAGARRARGRLPRAPAAAAPRGDRAQRPRRTRAGCSAWRRPRERDRERSSSSPSTSRAAPARSSARATRRRLEIGTKSGPDRPGDRGRPRLRGADRRRPREASAPATPCSPRRAAGATARAPPGAGSSTPSTAPPTTPTATRASASRSASSATESATLGVVYDPLLDELYHAVRGGGAYRNGRPIRVSPETRLDRSLLATGFAYDARESAEDNLNYFGAFLKNARALRRDGSAALDLCYVACGRLRRLLGAEAASPGTSLRARCSSRRPAGASATSRAAPGRARAAGWWRRTGASTRPCSS